MFGFGGNNSGGAFAAQFGGGNGGSNDHQQSQNFFGGGSLAQPSGLQGGGGFLHGTPTQDATGGEQAGGGARTGGANPGGNAGDQIKRKTTAVSCYQVHQMVSENMKNGSDATLKLYGEEVQYLALTGVIRKLNNEERDMDTALEIFLDDQSAVVKVRKYFDGTSEHEAALHDSLEPSMMIRVVGTVRMHGSMFWLAAHKLEKLSDLGQMFADTVSQYRLMQKYQMKRQELLAQQGQQLQPAGAGAVIGNGAGTTIPQQPQMLSNSNYVAPPGGLPPAAAGHGAAGSSGLPQMNVVDMMAQRQQQAQMQQQMQQQQGTLSGTQLRDGILRVLREATKDIQDPSGLTLEEIAGKLGAGADMQEVARYVQDLCNDGQIFAGTTDDRYLPSDC
ncbi:unnamed protein product [Amoebophrya sp. A120]|nr:unnamed protein product [Amoebophrya sp. A120]|eukprot:GSA120T00010946001.1